MKSGATFQGSKDVSIFWQPRRHFLCWFGSNNIFRLQIDSKFDKLLFGTCARAFLVTTWPIIARYNLAVGMLRDTLARYTFKSTKTHKINDPDALASTWLGTPFHSFHGFVFLAWFYVVRMPLYSTSASALRLLPMAARAPTFHGSHMGHFCRRLETCRSCLDKAIHSFMPQAAESLQKRLDY